MESETDKQLTSMLEDSKKLSLSKEEKGAMRLNVLGFIKKNPPRASTKEQWNLSYAGIVHLMKNISRKPALMYSFSVLLLFMCSYSGISFAAHDALPGDILYP